MSSSSSATDRTSRFETEPLKRSVGRTNSGLGRSLGGILGEALVVGTDSSLLQLLGGQHSERAGEIRQFVADMAVGSIKAKFDAEAVLLVSTDADLSVSLVSSDTPPSWGTLCPTSFEISGTLWTYLSSGRPYSQQRIADKQVWFCGQHVQQNSLAVAVVRDHLFADQDQETLDRFVRSVSMAISATPEPVASEFVLEVSARSGAGTATAEVLLTLGDEQRRACGVDSSVAMAVARAAALTGETSCTVAYAGQAAIDEHTVNMAVVLDRDNAPLVGLAVLPIGDQTGPARAVYSALASVGGQPFGDSSSALR